MRTIRVFLSIILRRTITKAASNPPTGPEDLQRELHDVQQWLEHGPDANCPARQHGKATAPARTPAPSTPPSPPSPRLVTVLEQDVLLSATDSTSMTNLIVEVPNALWPKGDDDDWDEAGYTICTVVGRCADGFAYTEGRSAPSHIIECDGDLFPVKTSALKDFVARQQRREGKQRASN